MIAVIPWGASTGCSKYGALDLVSTPDATEIVRRYREVVDRRSSRGPYHRVRAYGEMKIGSRRGPLEVEAESTHRYGFKWVSIDLPSELAQRRFGQSPRQSRFTGGWDGVTEWTAVDGKLETGLPRASVPESSYAALGFQVQLLTKSQSVRLLDVAERNDTSAYVLEVTEDSISTRMFIDTDSFLLVGIETTSPSGTLSLDYSDWKLLDGEFVPTKLVGTKDDQEMLVTFEQVEHDTVTDQRMWSRERLLKPLP